MIWQININVRLAYYYGKPFPNLADISSKKQMPHLVYAMTAFPPYPTEIHTLTPGLSASYHPDLVSLHGSP